MLAYSGSVVKHASTNIVTRVVPLVITQLAVVDATYVVVLNNHKTNIFQF